MSLNNKYANVDCSGTVHGWTVFENEAKKYFILNLYMLSKNGFTNAGPEAQAGMRPTRTGF